MALKKNDFFILSKIIENDGVRKLKGYTVKGIMEMTKYSDSKIRNSLKTLMEHNFVEEGYYQKNSKTYYATKLGIETLSNEVKGE